MKSNLKVSTWTIIFIITSIAACPVKLSETLVIMSVSIFKMDVILYTIVLLLLNLLHSDETKKPYF